MGKEPRGWSARRRACSRAAAARVISARNRFLCSSFNRCGGRNLRIDSSKSFPSERDGSSRGDKAVWSCFTSPGGSSTTAGGGNNSRKEGSGGKSHSGQRGGMSWAAACTVKTLFSSSLEAAWIRPASISSNRQPGSRRSASAMACCKRRSPPRCRYRNTPASTRMNIRRRNSQRRRLRCGMGEGPSRGIMRMSPLEKR